MRRLLLLCGLGLLVFSMPVSALGSYPAGSTGYDVSWPNCGATPPTAAAFGIVGINDGRVFTGNPCLHEEASWFNNLALYLSTSYPGKPRALKYPSSPKTCSLNDENCLAYNYGYNAAHYAVSYAGLQDTHTTSWWLDVETVNSWTSDVTANTESLQGMVDALRHYTFFPSIGFYAYPGQWQALTYGWHNDLPTWVATGSLNRDDALTACTQPSFDGTKVVLTQYTAGLDRNYVCP